MFKHTQKPLMLGLTVVMAAVLSACAGLTAAPEVKRPDWQMPAKLIAVGTATQVDWLAWWKGFDDPVLNTLLEEAKRNNQDLALASARVTEAAATLNLNQSNFFPSVDLNASSTRQRYSQNSATYNSGISQITTNHQLGLSASYEIDFWGKYSHADDAARARLLSQMANQGTVLSTLYANVAQSYFALRALDAQTQLAEQTFATRKETLRLQQRRFDAGVIGELDLRQAESEAASVEANLRTVRQNRSNAEAAMAVLLGRKPTQILEPVVARGVDLAALYARQAIPAELPSDVLLRRPDIVSAEQNLIAANADIGQARTSYFPKLSLTAALGRQSKDLSTLFDPASMFWNMIGNLTQPVFRAGAIGAVVAAANARQEQALAQYTQTVQNAFRDVHDALNNVTAGRDITDTSTRRMEALRTSLRLSELRYKNGYSSYLEVLNAQRDLAQAQSGLIDSQRNQLNAVVSLYKALGGGWDAASLSPVASK